MFIIRNKLLFQNINLKGSWSNLCEVVGVRLSSQFSPLYFVSIYIPLNSRLNLEHLIEMFGQIPEDGKIILMGDFNAHVAYFNEELARSVRPNRMGKIVTQFLEQRDLVLMNDAEPTYRSPRGNAEGVLDLCIVSSTLALLSESKTADESYGSDHLLVLLNFSLVPDTVCVSSNRLRTEKVEWGEFYIKINERKPEVENDSLNCLEKYDQFSKIIVESLLDSGAYILRNIKFFSPVKPSWWSTECDQAITRKKKARKEYRQNPSRNNFNKIEIERETGKIISDQKNQSFKELCNSISPNMGTKRIWSLIRAFSGKRSTNVSN